MKYRLYIVLLLLVTLFSGCGSSAALTSPVSAPGQIETTTAANLSTTQATASAEAAAAETTVPGATAPNDTVPGASNPMRALVEEVVPDNPMYHTTECITINAIGDITTNINCMAYAKDGDNYNFDPTFSVVMPVLQSADLSIANLETTIAGESAVYTHSASGYPSFNTPDTMLDTLKKSGLDVLITSNNHCLDRGTAGLARTIDQLDARGILHTGTYKTKEDSEEILVTDVNGIKIAILAYSYGTNGHRPEEPCMVNLLDMDKMISDVKRAKKLKPDVIIAHLHFGNEYARQPSDLQKNIADSLIKAGVDIILGDHTHVLQPIERKTLIDDTGREKDGFVIYSLGSFVSGQSGSYRDLGIILNIVIQKDMTTGITGIKAINPIPTWIQFYNKDGRDRYRVVPIRYAIEGYENKTDSLISADDYEFLKAKLPEMIQFVENGPEK